MNPIEIINQFYASFTPNDWANILFLAGSGGLISIFGTMFIRRRLAKKKNRFI